MCVAMYMIVNATYTIQMTIVVFQHAPDIFEQLFPVGFCKRFLPVFGAENNLNQALRVGAHTVLVMCIPRVTTRG